MWRFLIEFMCTIKEWLDNFSHEMNSAFSDDEETSWIDIFRIVQELKHNLDSVLLAIRNFDFFKELFARESLSKALRLPNKWGAACFWVVIKGIQIHKLLIKNDLGGLTDLSSRNTRLIVMFYWDWRMLWISNCFFCVFKIPNFRQECPWSLRLHLRVNKHLSSQVFIAAAALDPFLPVFTQVDFNSANLSCLYWLNRDFIALNVHDLDSYKFSIFVRPKLHFLPWENESFCHDTTKYKLVLLTFLFLLNSAWFSLRENLALLSWAPSY